MRSAKLEVQVLADQHFGLTRDKAGVIMRTHGRRTRFLGNANESKQGWRINYELLWADESAALVVRMQVAFDALWQHPLTCPPADALIADVGRLARRRAQSLPAWNAVFRARVGCPRNTERTSKR